MRKYIYFLIFILALTITASPAWCDEEFIVTHAQIDSYKKQFDDPSPFYTDTHYLKDLIPQEAWDMCVYDVEEMKKVWSEVVGFKAPEVVGKIAPEITPGKYTLEDKERLPFKELMPEYLYNKFNEPGQGPYPNLVGHFTEFEIVPTRQYYRALPLAKTTLKNIGVAQLDEKGYLIDESYKGGFPFPRPSGEYKAQQIIFNLQRNLAFLNWDSYVMIDNATGVDKNFKIDHVGSGKIYSMRTGNRIMPPVGWFDKRAEQQGEEGINVTVTYTPRDSYGNSYGGISYYSTDKENILMAYVNILRRIRKMSSSDKQDQAVGMDLSFDDINGLSQKLLPDIYPYDYKILAEREYLVATYELEGDIYFDLNDKFKLRNLQLERRPVWVVEMKQKDPNYLYSRRIAYVDKEMLQSNFWMMYDQKGRLYRVYQSFYAFLPPMGVLTYYQKVQEDHIDTHSTCGFCPSYPNPYLKRGDCSIQSMVKQK